MNGLCSRACRIAPRRAPASKTAHREPSVPAEFRLDFLQWQKANTVARGAAQFDGEAAEELGRNHDPNDVAMLMLARIADKMPQPLLGVTFGLGLENNDAALLASAGKIPDRAKKPLQNAALRAVLQDIATTVLTKVTAQRSIVCQAEDSVRQDPRISRRNAQKAPAVLVQAPQRGSRLGLRDARESAGENIVNFGRNGEPSRRRIMHNHMNIGCGHAIEELFGGNEIGESHVAKAETIRHSA